MAGYSLQTGFAGAVGPVDGLATSHHLAERRQPGQRARTGRDHLVSADISEGAAERDTFRYMGSDYPAAPAGTLLSDGGRACSDQPPVTAQPAAPTPPARRMTTAMAVVRLTARPPAGQQGMLCMSTS